MRARASLSLLAICFLNACPGDPHENVTFCMQWANTSTYAVVFHAKDNTGAEISTYSMNPPGIGDAFAGPKIQITGQAPITFSTNAIFSPVTFKPSGGNKVLIVEATRISTVLDHYEDNGTCP